MTRLSGAGLRRALAEAQRAPAGRDRSRRLEDVVESADDLGEDPLAAAARIALIDSYRFGGESARQFAPFAWLLARYDENPDWWTDRDRFTVLWMFKWVTVGMIRFPRIPMDRIRSGIEDMADRFAAAGEGPEPVLAVRYVLAAHRDGHHQAHGSYREWVRAPRTHLSDCPACNRTRQVAHLGAVRQDAAAVRLAEPVLTGRLTCDQQPHGIIAKTMEPLWHLEQHDRAQWEHRRGVRLLRAGGHAFTYADHLLLCARAAQPRRGLDLYERWVATAVDSLDPARLLRFLTSSARVLTDLARAGESHLLVRPAPPMNAHPGGPGDSAELLEPRSVGDLAARLTEQALLSAARFDRRNGNSTVSEGVRRDLTGEVDDRDTSSNPATARRSQGSRVPGAELVVRSGTGPAPGPAPADAGSRSRPLPRQLSTVQDAVLPEDPISLVETYLRAREHEDTELSDAALARWRRPRRDSPSVPGPDSRTRLAIARLDLWTAVDDLADLTLGTAPLLVAIEDALARMRAEGAEQEALLGDLGRIHQAVEYGRIPVADVIPHIEDVISWFREHGEPQILGRALATAVLIRFRFPSAGGPGPWATKNSPTERDLIREGIQALRSVPAVELGFRERSALIMLLRMSALGLDDDDVETILRQCLDLVPMPVLPTQRALLRADLARITERRDPAAAIRLLRSAIADVEPLRRPDLLGRLLGSLAHVLRSQGRSVETVSALSRAIPLLAGALPQLALDARFDLARVLIERSEHDRAVEVAESLVAEVTALLDANGEHPAPGVAPRVSREDPEREPSSAVGEHLLFLAGAGAFAAAEAYAGVGDRRRARRMAALSASWHRRSRNSLAEAEAWYLLSSQTDTAERLGHLDHAVALTEIAGDRPREMVYRRMRITVIYELDGIDAALDARTELLDRIDRDIEQHRPGPSVPGPSASSEEPPAEADTDGLRWHRWATVELGARLYAESGRIHDALRELDGTAEAFRKLGDPRSERDVLGLRGHLLWDLGDREAGLEDLRRAANQALAQGDQDQARRFGRDLATRLDGWGRPEEAEIAWARFGG